MLLKTAAVCGCICTHSVPNTTAKSNSSNPADFRQQEPTLLLQMPLQVSYPLLLQFNQLLLCQFKQLCRAAQGCRLAARLCDTAPQQLQPRIMGGPCLQPAQDKQRGQHRGEWLAASWHANMIVMCSDLCQLYSGGSAQVVVTATASGQPVTTNCSELLSDMQK